MDVEESVLNIVRVADEAFARKVLNAVFTRLEELGRSEFSAIDLSKVSASMSGGGGGGRSGWKGSKRSTWAKLLKSVDYTKKKATGFSLQGDWVKSPMNLEGLPEDALVVMSVNRRLSILQVTKGGVATVSSGGTPILVNGARILYDPGTDDYGAIVAWCKAYGVPQTKKEEEEEDDDEWAA